MIGGTELVLVVIVWMAMAALPIAFVVWLFRSISRMQAELKAIRLLLEMSSHQAVEMEDQRSDRTRHGQ